MSNSRYKKILMATDFHTDRHTVIDTATSMRDLHGAELHIVNVVEPITVNFAPDMMGYGDQVYALQSDIRKESQKNMEELCNTLGVAKENGHVVEGKAASEIHKMANEQSIDLVILGTHGQAGMQLLLGSTANGVLHGCECDVLAVRIHD